MGGILGEGKAAGVTGARADLLPLLPPGFLWYGHRIAQPVEGLAHAAEEAGISKSPYRTARCSRTAQIRRVADTDYAKSKRAMVR